MAHPDFDVAILGGGLAGLSLATRLVDSPGCRTVVVEPRTDYPRDRTWSYWRLVDHPFQPAIAKRWNRWEVLRRTKDGKVSTTVRTSNDLPYEMIPADRLYALATRTLTGAPGIELRQGCRVLSVDERPDRVVVETTAGKIEASYVFDSRPPAPTCGDTVQRFLGQEVVTERPVFDPGCVTLMDFAVPQCPGCVHFLYVLPTSPTEALVEDTWLAPAEAELPDHRRSIRTYLAERFGVSSFAVTFEEEGAIPMSPRLQAAPRAGRLVSIGTAGGAVKPSSGYAFLGIQRMTASFAADLAAGRPPAPFQPRGGIARWMDAVFLDALQRVPEEAPTIFENLFARCNPDALIRFLNDVGRPADVARVIAAMPKFTMIAAASRMTFGRRLARRDRA